MFRSLLAVGLCALIHLPGYTQSNLPPPPSNVPNPPIQSQSSSNLELLNQAPVNQELLFQKAKEWGDEGLAAAQFLWDYMPETDKQQLNTQWLLVNIKYALKARQVFPWAKKVPLDIFLNDVLPYANTTERRDLWRPSFYKRFGKMVLDCSNAQEAVLKIMSQIQKELGVEYSTKRRRADQGPLESIELKMASCSGLSILAIDACRAVGIPARLTGIASWSHVRGNHNWLEVWINGQWHMTEYNSNSMDEGWVIDNCGLADTTNPIHRIYASSWKPSPENPNLKFPVVWGMSIFISQQKPNIPSDYKDKVIITPFLTSENTTHYFVMTYSNSTPIFPGIDVSTRYKQLAKIQKEKKEKELAKKNSHQLQIGFFSDGKQIAKDFRILLDNQEILTGKTNDKEADLNNLKSFNVPPKSKIVIEYQENGQTKQLPLTTGEKTPTIQRINL